MRPLALIVAHAIDGVIGYQGDMPWHHPADLKHFKQITSGHAIIMGRTSYEAIGRPLPKRRNIVLSRSNYSAEGIEVFSDLEQAIAAARATDEEPFIIGGGQIYELALPLVTHCFITEINEKHPGDAFFTSLNPNEWDLIDSRSDGPLTFKEYRRQETHT